MGNKATRKLKEYRQFLSTHADFITVLDIGLCCLEDMGKAEKILLPALLQKAQNQ